jgi:hypothetical protein
VARKGVLHMKRAFRVLVTVLVILPWFSGARVQAEMIQWSASGSPLGPNYDPYNGTAFIKSFSNSNSAIDFLSGPTTNGTNSGSVVFVTTSTYDNTLGASYFGGSSANYSLSLSLRDLASGVSGSLTFRGNLSGWIDPEGNGHVDLTNTFLGSTTQALTLGRNLYTVTIGSFVNPGVTFSPPGGAPGSISASISVEPATNATPEPSSLLLALLGLPSLGLAGRFRRRRNIVDGNDNKA